MKFSKAALPVLSLLALSYLASEAQAMQDFHPEEVDTDDIFTRYTKRAKIIKLGESTTCESNDDCYEPPYNTCDLSTGYCKHKDIFPQKPIEIAGLIVFSFIMALCTVAGIGGGGVATSLLMAFFYFETKEAIAISTLSILICSTMRYIYSLANKHPDKPEMNLVDYSIAAAMMPLTLAGSQIGGYILDMFPNVIIQILLTLLLAFLTWRTTQKAMQLHRKEQQYGVLDRRSKSIENTQKFVDRVSRNVSRRQSHDNDEADEIESVAPEDLVGSIEEQQKQMITSKGSED